MDFCPNCNIGLDYKQSQRKHCNNCGHEWTTDGWIAAKVECNLCSHQWVAVYPADCEKLECPNCENLSLFNVIEYVKK